MDDSGATSYLVIAGSDEDVAAWAVGVGLDARQPWVKHARIPSDFMLADARNTVIALGPGFFQSRWFNSPLHIQLQRQINQATGRPKAGLARFTDLGAGFLAFMGLMGAWVTLVWFAFAGGQALIRDVAWTVGRSLVTMAVLSGWSIAIGAALEAWTGWLVKRSALRFAAEAEGDG